VTALLLMRHAAHDWLGRGIPGRMPGVAINGAGQLQAREMAQRLDTRIDAIYSSPQQRALETVTPIANKLALPVTIANEFDEIDFGDWSGKTFAQIADGDATRWHEWLDRRSTATPPGGEPFAAVAQRAWAGAERLGRLHSGQTVLVLSHGDVIRALLACCLGLSLEHLERFDIAPASLSVVMRVSDGWRVLRINQVLTGPLLPP
jgi:broad specificity phosphatase PhoE